MSVAMLPHMLELELQLHHKRIPQEKWDMKNKLSNHMSAAESGTINVVSTC